jgi:hypothetical protein
MRDNHQLHHVLIAQAMTIGLLTVTTTASAIALPAIFYTAREIAQYTQGKRHNGKFDWGGCIPVIISQSLIGAIVWCI